MSLNKIKLENLHNKILYLLSQKSIVFKYSLMSAMVILLFSLWLFLFVRPLNVKFKVARAKLKQLNNLKKIYSQSYDQCADLTNKIEHLNSKINRKINSIGAMSAHSSLGKVIDCINNNGVTLIDYSPIKVNKISNKAAFLKGSSKGDTAEKNASLNKTEFGKKASFELTLEGTFGDMFNCLKCLSNIKYCLKYNQITITQNERGFIKCKMLLDILQVSRS